MKKRVKSSEESEEEEEWEEYEEEVEEEQEEEIDPCAEPLTQREVHDEGEGNGNPQFFGLE